MFPWDILNLTNCCLTLTELDGLLFWPRRRSNYYVTIIGQCVPGIPLYLMNTVLDMRVRSSDVGWSPSFARSVLSDIPIPTHLFWHWFSWYLSFSDWCILLYIWLSCQSYIVGLCTCWAIGSMIIFSLTFQWNSKMVRTLETARKSCGVSGVAYRRQFQVEGSDDLMELILLELLNLVCNNLLNLE